MDEEFYTLARAHITSLLRQNEAMLHDESLRILEIGPTLCWPHFHTLDIRAGAMFTADITTVTPLAASSYDLILCMEVLEHTLDPFAAVREVRRLLCDGGLLLASSPLNFRIHGPANDCFRFTEHGIKVLMKDFDALDISVLEAPNRPLFPVHYNWTARCNKSKSVSHESVAKTFRWIT